MKPKQLLYAICTIVAMSFMQKAAAQIKITGLINDVEGKAISNASIMLLNAADSVLTKGTTTKINGEFFIEKLSPGSYISLCTNVGYTDHYSKIFKLDENLNIKSITLLPQTGEL